MKLSPIEARNTYSLDIITLFPTYSADTGLPAKDATSTTTVELLSGLVKKKLALCSHSLTVPELAILFINVYEGIIKGKYLLHC